MNNNFEIVSTIKTRTFIFLSAYRNSGKDTFYELAKEILGDKVMRLSFADTIKNDISEKTGIPINYFHERQLKDTQLKNTDLKNNPNFFSLFEKTPRDIGREYANEKQSIDPSYFSKIALKSITNETPQFIVITDFRIDDNFYDFKNKFVNDNIVTIRIVRDTIPPPPENETEEHALDKFVFDFKIENNSTFDNYKKTIREFFYKNFNS
jgi:hypothetical protein